MIHTYVFKKVANTVITKVLQGDSRGLKLYLKRAAFGVVIALVTSGIFIVIGLVVLVQFLFSLLSGMVN